MITFRAYREKNIYKNDNNVIKIFKNKEMIEKNIDYATYSKYNTVYFLVFFTVKNRKIKKFTLSEMF